MSTAFTEAEIRAWAAEACPGTVTRAQRVAGGNRCQGWAIDVQKADGSDVPLFLRFQAFETTGVEPFTTRREAEIYRALQPTRVPIPRLIALHPTRQAMLTERVSGQAEFRHLKDESHKATIAREFAAALAELHRQDVRRLAIRGLAVPATVTEAVRAELALWWAMYQETERPDALIEFGRDWLAANLPEVPDVPSLIHGDAGPGNFLFENGHLTTLLDWELAHLGDPMEDLAWLSMRSVMEPVPSLPDCLDEYDRHAAAPVDVARLRYHRALVSFRVCIIRHRNVSGEPGASLVSRTLNRRLLVTAIAEASGATLPEIPVARGSSDSDALYEHVLAELRDTIVPRSTDRVVIGKTKDLSKVVKYLQAQGSIGADAARLERDAITSALGRRPESLETGRAALVAAIRAGTLDRERALACFAVLTGLETQLAAGAMGGLAKRGFPPLGR